MRLLTALFLLGFATTASAQDTTGGPPPAVFLDCQAPGCDTSHIRNEIRFVDWVRDRADADVYVLATALSTGSGGESFRITLVGQRRFGGDSTEVRFAVEQNSTGAERRDELTRRLAQGLVRYAALTSAARRISIVSDDDDGDDDVASRVARDPWNFWVFSAGVSAELEGESREQQREVEVSLSADRVTELWKVELRLEGTHDEQEFELTERTVRSVRRDYEADFQIDRAVGGQWATGLRAEIGTSTFANQELYARTAALLEYSFFPYTEFSRRRVTLQYSLGARHFDYEEITIYDRLSEQRADQQLALNLEYRQPWGSARIELSGAHYLHDTRRYNLSTFASLDIRLVRGLSLDISGNYERVRDQIYIPKGDASDEEVLLRRRALETGYRYGMNLGLRYTFGSIYNNVVNPRLEDDGGGGDRR